MARVAFKKKAGIEFQVGQIKVSKENNLPENIHILATSELLSNREILEVLNKDLGITEDDIIYLDDTEPYSPLGLDIVVFEVDLLDALKDPIKLKSVIEQLEGYRKTLEFYQNFNNPYIKIQVAFD